MTEIKLNWENINNWWVISIPYEINHNFFVEISLKTQKQLNKLPFLNIAWPDFWRWFILKWEILNKFIKDCEYIKYNIDEIIKIIPLPKEMWKFDNYHINWFILKNELDNYIEWSSELKKEDIILLLDLMIKKANESISKWIWLKFIWD